MYDIPFNKINMLSFIDFPDEIINYICEYLPIVDKYNIKTTCKNLYDQVNISLYDFESVFRRRLLTLFPDNVHFIEKFIDLIKNNNNITIGGSIILQCLNNEFYDNSDIDIYIYTDLLKNKCYDMSKLTEIGENIYMKNIELYKMTNIVRSYTDLVPDTDLEWLGINPHYIFNLLCINYYKNNNNIKNPPILQIIILSDEQKNSDSMYDFSFCKNMYDGTNVYSLYKDHVIKKTDVVNSWKNIIANTNKSINHDYVYSHIVSRINKYLDRGYIICNMDEIYKQKNTLNM